METSCSDHPPVHSHSLNRTMQYGNYSEKSYFREVSRFKSYYVVWKPICAARVVGCPILFKSYYVVWKHSIGIPHIPQACRSLNRTMQYGNLEIFEPFNTLAKRFKSYYVVWKRYRTTEYFRIFGCLNRTMQYGNYLVSTCSGWL